MNVTLHSLVMLLATTVQFLVWKNRELANHIARNQNIKQSIRVGKLQDLIDFEDDMVVGARKLFWVFQNWPSLRFTKNGPKTDNESCEGRYVQWNVSLMLDVQNSWFCLKRKKAQLAQNNHPSKYKEYQHCTHLLRPEANVQDEQETTLLFYTFWLRTGNIDCSHEYWYQQDIQIIVLIWYICTTVQHMACLIVMVYVSL